MTTSSLPSTRAAIHPSFNGYDANLSVSMPGLSEPLWLDISDEEHDALWDAIESLGPHSAARSEDAASGMSMWDLDTIIRLPGVASDSLVRSSVGKIFTAAGESFIETGKSLMKEHRYSASRSTRKRVIGSGTTSDIPSSYPETNASVSPVWSPFTPHLSVKLPGLKRDLWVPVSHEQYGAVCGGIDELGENATTETKGKDGSTMWDLDTVLRRSGTADDRMWGVLGEIYSNKAWHYSTKAEKLRGKGRNRDATRYAAGSKKYTELGKEYFRVASAIKARQASTLRSDTGSGAGSETSDPESEFSDSDADSDASDTSDWN